MTEDELCREFATQIATSPEFVVWVLEQTKFKEQAKNAALLHKEQIECRAKDQGEWWQNFRCAIPESAKQGRRTDIFLVFENSANKKRFAVNVKNKKAKGVDFEGQAEEYNLMGGHMMQENKYNLNYTDFTTLLIAPKAFKESNLEASSRFDSYISYETMADFIPAFNV